MNDSETALSHGAGQNENETKAEVGPGEQEGAVPGPPPPVGGGEGGSGVGKAPKMGCAASGQARVVEPTTSRLNQLASSGATASEHSAEHAELSEHALTKLEAELLVHGEEGEGEHEPIAPHQHAGSTPQAPRDDMRGKTGPLRHDSSLSASKAKAEELKRRMDQRDKIHQQMQCDKETDQESLNKKLETLFDALRGSDPALMKNKHGILREEQKKVLADGLIALGISRRADDFINDLLDKSTAQLNASEFTAKVQEELQISLRSLPLDVSFLVRIYHCLSADPPRALSPHNSMMWLQEQTEILREIAKVLPSPKAGTDDPLGGIRALKEQTPEQRKEGVIHGVSRSVEKCLEESIQNLSRTQELLKEEETSKHSNSKFSFDSSLFEAKWVYAAKLPC